MNVFNFLQACQEDFFIPSDQLFSVSEIYKDDSTVLLRTIKLVEGLLSRIEGATWLAPHDASSVQLTSFADTKSKRLSFMVDNDNVSPTLGPVVSPERAETSRTSNDNIHADLRKKAVRELLETERTYVSQLDVLQEYLQEIECDSEKSITQEDMDIIFCNLNELVDFQRFFLIDMEATLTKPTDQQRLGQLFLSTITHTKTFASYYQYVENFERAIDAIKRNVDQLKKYESKISHGQLQSFLIKPIQRICRYHILLKEIKKHSDKSALETINIIKAYDLMKKIADQVNEEKRKAENIQVMEELRGSVQNWGMGYSVDSFKPLQLYGTLPVKFDTSTEEKQMHVFVFEKALLLGKSSNKQAGVLSSSNLSIIECIEKNFVTNIQNDSKDDNLQLKIYWHAEKIRWLSLSFINEEVFKKWYLSLIRLTSQHDEHHKSVQNTSAAVATAADLKPSNKLARETISQEKATRRKSKLKKLLGSPNIKSSSQIITDEYSLEERETPSSRLPSIESVMNPPQQRLVKIITSTFAKLAVLPSDDDFEVLKEFLSSAFSTSSKQFSIFYRDRQKDALLLESDADLELACKDWFESDRLEGAFPLILKSDDEEPNR
ncbi:Guanine nucleotide exchange factor for Cdc42p [Mitosporidium daphniae]